MTASPCDALDLPASRGRRDRVVDVDGAAALIAALPTALDRALRATALYAGLRRGELLALRWQDVDLEAGLIRVERSYVACCSNTGSLSGRSTPRSSCSASKASRSRTTSRSTGPPVHGP